MTQPVRLARLHTAPFTDRLVAKFDLPVDWAGGARPIRTAGRLSARRPDRAVVLEMRITGLGVIEDATLEPDPGLTVVTGETGAGKTMVVTGLGLLFGGRADAGLVRPTRRGRGRGPAARRAGVPPPRSARVAEAGAEPDDDGALLLAAR